MGLQRRAPLSTHSYSNMKHWNKGETWLFTMFLFCAGLLVPLYATPLSTYVLIRQVRTLHYHNASGVFLTLLLHELLCHSSWWGEGKGPTICEVFGHRSTLTFYFSIKSKASSLICLHLAISLFPCFISIYQFLLYGHSLILNQSVPWRAT